MNIKQYLQQFMGIDDDEYKSYSVKSYNDNKELKEILSSFLKKHKGEIALKACYANSLLMMKADPRIGYIEGMVSYNIGGNCLPIEHAWNVFGDDFYFDITSEHLFNGDIGKGHNEYAELYRTYDKKEAHTVASAVIRPYMRRRRR